MRKPWVVDNVELSARRITLHCHVSTPQQNCPHCLRPTSQSIGGTQYTRRQVRDLDMSGRQVWLEVRVRQFFCPDCERYFSEELGFADSGKSFTHRQAKWIFECCASSPSPRLARCSMSTPRPSSGIYYQHVRCELDLPARYAAVRRLGIDEISHRKGKGSYCCVLTDLDKKHRPGRAAQPLKGDADRSFQEAWAQSSAPRSSRSAYDMWSAYHTVSQRFFPQAVHVVDRFHVVKALNKALDTFRRKLRREQPEVEAFNDIKWDLFKAQPTAAQEVRLQEAFAHSPLLGEMVALRNDFHMRFESATNPDELEQALQKWIVKARVIRQRGLIDFIHTLENWLRPIANFAHQRLTNAATEGLNNVIRYVKRISYGLPKFEHLRLRVLAQAI